MLLQLLQPLLHMLQIRLDYPGMMLMEGHPSREEYPLMWDREVRRREGWDDEVSLFRGVSSSGDNDARRGIESD